MGEDCPSILKMCPASMREFAISHSNMFYYAAFALYSLTCFIGRTEFQTIFGVSINAFRDAFNAVALAFLVLKFISQPTSTHSVIVSLLIVLVGFLSWRASKEGVLFWLILFIVCSYGIDIKQLAAIVLVVVVPLLLITIACCEVGIIENYTQVRDGGVRQSLGFTHPNVLASYLLLVCTAISTIRFESNPIPSIALLLLAAAIEWIVADSRTSVLMSIAEITLLLIFGCVKSPRYKRTFSIGFSIIAMLGVIISLFFTFFYDSGNPLHYSLNNLLSGRLSLAHEYYEMQPISLFGTTYDQFAPIYWENGAPASFLVDNSYCRLILRYGIIPTALFLAGYFSLMFRLVKKRQWNVLLFGLTLFSIYGISETVGIRIEYNYFMASIGCYLLYSSDNPEQKLVDYSKLTSIVGRELSKEMMDNDTFETRTAISFVIPAFQAQQTIERAIQSILHLGLKSNFEVIVVDDGSSDATASIVEAMALRDSRIQMIRQENHGRSQARNVGIDAATGKWVMFVDADDWLLPGTAGALEASLNIDGLDLIVFGYALNEGGAKHFSYENPQTKSLLTKESVQLANRMIWKGWNDVTEFSSLFEMNSCWARLYNRQRLQRLCSALPRDWNPFPVGVRLSEDRLMNLAYLRVGGDFRVGFCPMKIYCWNLADSQTVARINTSDISSLNVYYRALIDLASVGILGKNEINPMFTREAMLMFRHTMLSNDEELTDEQLFNAWESVFSSKALREALLPMPEDIRGKAGLWTTFTKEIAKGNVHRVIQLCRKGYRIKRIVS